MRALTCALLAFLLTSAALADGGFFGKAGALVGYQRVSSVAQRGVIIQPEPGREVLLLQTTYSGPAEEFSWVIPVPGLPKADGVFLASQQFLDEAFEASKPQLKMTFLTEQGRVVRQYKKGLSDLAVGVGGEMMDADMGAAVPVTVHSRSEVGEYEATVLSARGGQALIDWLQEKGFHVPEDATPIIEEYTAKKWYFVALRVRPSVAKRERVVEDAPPIGIEFATPKLVFPLDISRVSAPEWQRIELVIAAPAPVDCEELPVVDIPEEMQMEPGESYGTVRRRLATANGPCLVRERACPSPTGYKDLSCRAGEWGGTGDTPVHNLWATSFFALLKRDDLHDLSFVPSASYQPAAKIGWRAALDCTVCVDRHGHRREPSAWGPTAPMALGVLALILFLTGATQVSLATGHRISWRRPGGVVMLLALLLAVLCVASVWGEGRSHEQAERAMWRMDAALATVDNAIAAFHQDCGCYPASLDDLAQSDEPEAGLDSSGNEVAVGEGFSGPYFQLEWNEPLAEHGHGWVYEVTGPVMVYPSVFRTILRRQDTRPRSHIYWNRAETALDMVSELQGLLAGGCVPRVAPSWAADHSPPEARRLALVWRPETDTVVARPSTSYGPWNHSAWAVSRDGILLVAPLRNSPLGDGALNGAWWISSTGNRKACDRPLPPLRLLAADPRSPRYAFVPDRTHEDADTLRVVGEDGRAGASVMKGRFHDITWDAAGNSILALRRPGADRSRPKGAVLYRAFLDGRPPAKLAEGLDERFLQVTEAGVIVIEAAEESQVSERVPGEHPAHWVWRTKVEPHSVLLVRASTAESAPIIRIPQDTLVEDIVACGSRLLLATYPVDAEDRWGEIRSIPLTRMSVQAEQGKLVGWYLSDGGRHQFRVVGTAPEGLAVVWLPVDSHEQAGRAAYRFTPDGKLKRLAMPRPEADWGYHGKIEPFTAPQGAPCIPRASDLQSANPAL